MHGTGDISDIAAKCFGHQSHGPCLELLTFAYPCVQSILSGEPHVVHGAGLGAADAGGGPCFVLGRIAGQPAGRVIFTHEGHRVQAFCTELSAAVLPSGLDQLPVPFDEFAEVHRMTIVPGVIAVIVRKARPRRIIIAVAGLDDPIGIREQDGLVESAEDRKDLFGIGVTALRGALCIRKSFIDISDHDRGGMRADEPLHLFSLLYGF